MFATDLVPRLVVHRNLSEMYPVGQEPDVLARLEKDLHALGLGPHLGPARLLFHLGLGRYAGVPCSAAVIGPSGVGKTTITAAISDLLPGEDTTSLTDVTFAALASGFGKDGTTSGNRTLVVDLRHTLLILDENIDMRSTDSRVVACIRQATSAAVTKRIKMHHGEPLTVQLLGPTSVWDCRLETVPVDYQTANRMVPMQLDAGQETLAAIMGLTAARPTMAGRRRCRKHRRISAQWQRYLRGLDHDLPVVIEFADQLTFRGPGAARITHGPRLLTAVHAVISSVAWLRQGLKNRVVEDGDGDAVIYATREDYRLAHKVLLDGNIMDERPSLPAPSLDLLRKWQSQAESTGNQPVTAPGLYRSLGISVDRGNMTRHLRPLLDLELVTELAGRNRNRQKLYQLTDLGVHSPTVGVLHTLPSPDAIEIPDEELFTDMAEGQAGLRDDSASSKQQ